MTLPVPSKKTKRSRNQMAHFPKVVRICQGLKIGEKCSPEVVTVVAVTCLSSKELAELALLTLRVWAKSEISWSRTT